MSEIRSQSIPLQEARVLSRKTLNATNQDIFQFFFFGCSTIFADGFVLLDQVPQNSPDQRRCVKRLRGFAIVQGNGSFLEIAVVNVQELVGV